MVDESDEAVGDCVSGDMAGADTEGVDKSCCRRWISSAAAELS
jgi:DNA-directed RNA polymerase subunit N (RpoN/RPB10)